MRHSERQSFNSCPYKFQLEHSGLKRREVGLHAEDRTFGIALHEGLKTLYDTRFQKDSVEAAITKFTEFYPDEKEYKSQAKSHESGCLALREYAEYWETQDKLWEILGTEVEDTVNFNGEDHVLHIDAVMRNKQTTEIWAWDHKTTEKKLGTLFFKKYELDSQITRYTYKILQQYGHCGGFIINAIQVGHRKRKYLDEPPGYYQRFERQPFSRSAAQLKFWLKSELDWSRLVDYATAANCWPKHQGSLCGWCDYNELCMSGGDEHVKDSLYTTNDQDAQITITDET